MDQATSDGEPHRLAAPSNTGENTTESAPHGLDSADSDQSDPHQQGQGGSQEPGGGVAPSVPELADLPAPSPESPESLIGSSAATREEVPPHPPHHTRHAGDERIETTECADDSGSSEPSTVWVSLDDLDELTIVARAQDGDAQAFDWLISAYQGGVYRLSFRMLNDRSDAEDIVQETFIAAWRNLPKLTAPQAFIPWLYRTATNKCLDSRRRRQRHPFDPTADLDATLHQSGTAAEKVEGERSIAGTVQPVDPAQEFENQAQMRALADLLQTVPPGPRACWLLREVHEFSYSEIAAIVQLPESTVRGRIARAKRFLAEGMEPWR